MKKFALLSSLLIVFCMHRAYAAPVSVASFVFDDSAFVSELTASTGTIHYSNNSPSAITDLQVTTYIYSDDGGSVNLAFNDATLYNNDGADLALFFLGNESTVDLSIVGSNAAAQTYSSSYLFDTNGNQYVVDIGGNLYGLSAALIEFDDFGLVVDDIVSEISVDLGTYNFLAVAAGFHTEPTVVPLPAPVMLFLSGFTVLAWFAARQRS